MDNSAIDTIVARIHGASNRVEVDAIFDQTKRTARLQLGTAEDRRQFWNALATALTRTEKAQSASALDDLYDYARQQAQEHAKREST